MTTPAHVTSIQALRDFRQALLRYEHAMRDTVAVQRSEIRRALDWVEHDRAQYWPAQWRKAEDQVALARSELELCKMASLKNEQRSCLDEKKQLERAVARQRLCEARVKDVRKWRQQMEHSSEEFETKLTRLEGFVERELPRAIAALDRMILSLEKYAEERKPSQT